MTNLISLIVKYYIYKCKCLNTKPTPQGAKREIVMYHEVEKIAVNKTQSRIPEGKWHFLN